MKNDLKKIKRLNDSCCWNYSRQVTWHWWLWFGSEFELSTAFLHAAIPAITEQERNTTPVSVCFHFLLVKLKYLIFSKGFFFHFMWEFCSLQFSPETSNTDLIGWTMSVLFSHWNCAEQVIEVAPADENLCFSVQWNTQPCYISCPSPLTKCWPLKFDQLICSFDAHQT